MNVESTKKVIVCAIVAMVVMVPIIRLPEIIGAIRWW